MLRTQPCRLQVNTQICPTTLTSASCTFCTDRLRKSCSHTRTHTHTRARNHSRVCSQRLSGFGRSERSPRFYICNRCPRKAAAASLRVSQLAPSAPVTGQTAGCAMTLRVLLLFSFSVTQPRRKPDSAGSSTGCYTRRTALGQALGK